MKEFGALYKKPDDFRGKKPDSKLNGIGIEIVNASCQLKCRHCYNGNGYEKDLEENNIGKKIFDIRKKSPNMTLKQVTNIIDQSIDLDVSEIYFIGAGETTLHPKLPEILEYSRDKLKEKNGNEFLMVVATNGIRLADEIYCRELVDTEAIIFPHFYVLENGKREIEILSEVIGLPIDTTRKIAEKQKKGRENLIRISREKYGVFLKKISER